MDAKPGEHVLSVAIPRPLDQLFTYRIPPQYLSKVKVGSLVRIPFGRSVTHGFVVHPPRQWDAAQAVEFNYSKIRDVLAVGDDDVALPKDVLDLCLWVKDYYHAPLGEVLGAAVPLSILGKNMDKEAKLKKKTKPPGKVRELPKHTLTSLQQGVLKECREQFAKNSPVLLEGITGSGKTEIYIDLAKAYLEQGKSVLVLVPEIALTPQLQDRFESGLGQKVSLWHSSVADGRRRETWIEIQKGKSRVVVGARSAVFAPLQNLGLIVVDEEHDPSYKQEDRLRYNARDLAVLRAKKTGANILLGSATPSFESYERVHEKKYALVKLLERPTAVQLTNDIEIVDLTKHDLVPKTQSPFATRTVEALNETLSRGEQAMIFLNRRGFSAFLLCQDCGEVPGCPDCSISLTFHKKRAELRCHQCGYSTPVPEQCSSCHCVNLLPMGSGTESLEDDLKPYLPQMRAVRLDRDQITSVKRLTEVLEGFRKGESNVLTGTQMLVKGHDFPNVTLVVVVLADGLFRWPDFRSVERAYQILAQVSGRAGRSEKRGRVLFQTYQPEHPVLKVLKGEKDLESFRKEELELREALHYPPFFRLARLRTEHTSPKKAQENAEFLAANLRASEAATQVELLGPSEAFIAKMKGTYRYDLLIKSKEIGPVSSLLKSARLLSQKNDFHLIVDMDPVSLG